MTRRSSLAVLAVLSTSLLSGCVQGRAPLLVGAASDLRAALPEVVAAFEEATGQEVTVTFGSSGQLAQQVLEGAPMDVLASADDGYVDQLVEAGRADPSSRAPYAVGRLVLWSRADAWGDWRDLAALADPGVRRVAIANPEHAPYGAAARAALESAGVWEELRPRLVLAQSVADAQRLAATGNADVALVALSLAVAADADGTVAATWRLVPDSFHPAIEQVAAVTTADPDRAATARAFVDHLTGPAGRAVLRAHGFAVPGETGPPDWDTRTLDALPRQPAP